MDPIAESQPLYYWQTLNIPADPAADPSFRQLQETRLREGLSFQAQNGETQRFLAEEAVRIGAALTGLSGEIRFQLPGAIIRRGEQKGESYTIDVPREFRHQIVAGLLNRLPLKDVRTAFRVRLSQLENSGYSSVRIGAGLLRFAVARHIVHELVPENRIPGPPMTRGNSVPALAASIEREETQTKDWQETGLIQNAEAAIFLLRSGMQRLSQAVSLAPYMYADEEYQFKWNVLLARLISHGHALAHFHLRDIVRKIQRRAGANDLNRGLWLSVPYFDDRALELKMDEFEAIPPGRMLFVPAFVALAAAREQEKIEQQNSLNPSTRLHLLAELKSLEQAFDNRPE